MSASPLVTVIMPVFNASATLAQALNSVLWQGYGAIEIIAVDDGSTDDSRQKLATYGDAVRVLHQSKQGPAAARNLALQHARGEYIAFVDADDVWLPGKLLRQVAYLQAHPDVSAVFGRFRRWETLPGERRFSVPPDQTAYAQAAARWREQPEPFRTTALQGNLYADLLLDSVVHIITALVRRSAVDEVHGFDARLNTGEDYDFWLRLSRAHRIDQLDDCVAWYRIHAQSITRQPWPHNAEYTILLRTLAQYGARGADGRSVSELEIQRRLYGIAFGHGYLHFWHGQAVHARRAFAQALSHSFWHPKLWAYWLLTFVRPGRQARTVG
ncbi:MAG: glycosyltransferase [Aquabacterium sp.]|jgi:glycosyltransferase involved in cell wall biosynthesis|uniref:glycosyltransferase family 2 protein n=1 Tax=Aquabacterium sp. TaxID=1872578 RepID=UPI002A362367|nr:glycosyltransferase [Aquabacterium sp.]MDX9843858.1 glycosyltransferase [Aquabacterium sp.]